MEAFQRFYNDSVNGAGLLEGKKKRRIESDTVGNEVCW